MQLELLIAHRPSCELPGPLGALDPSISGTAACPGVLYKISLLPGQSCTALAVGCTRANLPGPIRYRLILLGQQPQTEEGSYLWAVAGLQKVISTRGTAGEMPAKVRGLLPLSSKGYS